MSRIASFNPQKKPSSTWFQSMDVAFIGLKLTWEKNNEKYSATIFEWSGCTGNGWPKQIDETIYTKAIYITNSSLFFFLYKKRKHSTNKIIKQFSSLLFVSVHECKIENIFCVHIV